MVDGHNRRNFELVCCASCVFFSVASSMRSLARSPHDIAGEQRTHTHCICPYVVALPLFVYVSRVFFSIFHNSSNQINILSPCVRCHFLMDAQHYTAWVDTERGGDYRCD